MRLDRDLQRSMLEKLAAAYPAFIVEIRPDTEAGRDDDTFCANLYYLKEHGLVNASLDRTLGGSFIFSGATITAKGMDFLADDGGLSAILGVVTVRLHADTIRELLLTKVEHSDLTPEKKSWIKDKVSKMTDEALKTATKSLVEKGIENIPDLLQWVTTILGSGS